MSGDAVTRFVPITDAIGVQWEHDLPPTISTGIAAFDRKLEGGGFAYGMATLTGATGRGKSGLAIQLVRSWAKTRPVIYLYSEMGERQIIARIIAQATGESWRKILFMPPAQMAYLKGHATRNHGQNIYVMEVPKNPETLPGMIEDFITEHGGQIPILIFDYLQGAARRVEGADSVRSAVNRLVDMLNGIAETYRTVVLVLSAESRAESKADRNLKTAEGSITAAKESGDIEYAAAYTLALDFPLCPIGGSIPGKLYIGKQRYGAGGQTVGLRFHGATGTFTEDADAELTERQRDIIAAVRGGATSKNDVARKVGGKKQACIDIIDLLIKDGYILRTGIRLSVP